MPTIGRAAATAGQSTRGSNGSRLTAVAEEGVLTTTQIDALKAPEFLVSTDGRQTKSWSARLATEAMSRSRQFVFDFAAERVAAGARSSRPSAMPVSTPESSLAVARAAAPLMAKTSCSPRYRRAPTSSWTKGIVQSKTLHSGFRSSSQSPPSATVSAEKQITDGGTKSFAIDGPQPRAHLNGVEVGRLRGPATSWDGEDSARGRPSCGRYAPRMQCPSFLADRLLAGGARPAFSVPANTSPVSFAAIPTGLPRASR